MRAAAAADEPLAAGHIAAMPPPPPPIAPSASISQRELDEAAALGVDEAMLRELSYEERVQILNVLRCAAADNSSTTDHIAAQSPPLAAVAAQPPSKSTSSIAAESGYVTAPSTMNSSPECHRAPIIERREWLPEDDVYIGEAEAYERELVGKSSYKICLENDDALARATAANSAPTLRPEIKSSSERR